MRLHFVEKSKIKDYIDIFRKSVETYNTDWINSTTKQSPQDFIKKNIVTIKPWEFRKGIKSRIYSFKKCTLQGVPKKCSFFWDTWYIVKILTFLTSGDQKFYQIKQNIKLIEK